MLLFGEKSDDCLLGEIVCTLADMRVSDHPSLVNQMEGRPIPGVVALPYCEVVVDGYRVREPEPLHGILHVVEFPFPEELRRVDTDDDESLARVLLVPCLDPRQRPLTIDSPIRPEFQEHNLAPQLLKLQGIGVNPGCVGQLRRLAALQQTHESVTGNRRYPEEDET